MTTLTQNRFDAVAAPARRATTKPGLFAGLGVTLQTWRRRLDERNALAAFGWRDMQDIGITQSDVLGEISKPFWKA